MLSNNATNILAVSPITDPGPVETPYFALIAGYNQVAWKSGSEIEHRHAACVVSFVQIVVRCQSLATKTECMREE